MENASCDPLRRAAHEALSVGLGFGILGFNRLQVKRREWERVSGMTLPSASEIATSMSTTLGAFASLVADRGRR
ncbi:unannotated protein [freshwater metagenome]|uniref:Unannotated protein n=1 Tax=freshwater metagenome TaxID=449393 RepID=A0A6J6GJM3_9ZZZZ|nr:hypothetical protein [Actinomycetota bacterium]